MYIPEFVCGSTFTIIVEVVFLIAYTIYYNKKKK